MITTKGSMDANDNGRMSDRVNGKIKTNGSVNETLREIVEDYGRTEEREQAHFLVDLGEIYRQHIRWKTRLMRVKPFYAVKCNPDTKVLRLLASLGTGFDCASQEEMEKVLGLGVEPHRIIFANPVKARSHVRYAQRNGVRRMTFDGVDELYKIKEICPDAKLLLRIAADDSSSPCRFGQKFGAPVESAKQLLETARELELDVEGVSFHVGSRAVDPSSFERAVRDSRTVFDQAQDNGHSLKILDVGGGFMNESFDALAEALAGALDEAFPHGVELIAEPGRYYVASAFTVACNVIARRILTQEDGAKHVMLYLNDGVYKSFMDCLLSHWEPQPQILFCASSEASASAIKYTIWGNTCDGIDQIVETVLLRQLLNVGDWLYFEGMGAYSICLSTNFNGFSSEHKMHYISSESAVSGFAGEYQ